MDEVEFDDVRPGERSMGDVGDRLTGFSAPDAPLPAPSDLRRRGERARRRRTTGALVAAAAAVAVVAVSTSLASGDQGRALAPVVAGLCVFRAGGCLDRGPEISPVVTASGVGDLQLGASVEFLSRLPGVTVGRADGGGAPVTQRLDGSDVVVTGSVSDGCLVLVDLPEPAIPRDEPASTSAFSTSYVFADDGDIATAIRMTSPCRPPAPPGATILTGAGVGALRLGLEPGAAVALPDAHTLEPPDGAICASYVARPEPGVDVLVGFGLRSDGVAEIYSGTSDVGSGDPTGSLVTPEGITEGSSLGQLQAAYPGVVQDERGLWVAPAPGRPDRFYAFVVQDGLVSSFSLRPISGYASLRSVAGDPCRPPTVPAGASVLTPDGVDGATLGMSDVAARALTDAYPDPTRATARCEVVGLPRHGGLLLRLSRGELVSVSVGEIPFEEVSDLVDPLFTPEGVGRATPLQLVQASYPALERVGREWVAAAPGRPGRFYAFVVGDAGVDVLSVRSQRSDPCG